MSNKFVSKMWEDFFELLKDVNPTHFYNHPVIKQTITNVGSVYKNEVSRLIYQGNAELNGIYQSIIKGELFWKYIEDSLWRYVYHTYLIFREFDDITNIRNVLEIGSGYGGMYKIFNEAHRLITDYTVVDHQIMLNIFKSFVDQCTYKNFPKTNAVDICVVDTLEDQKFDLFISSLCLSETTPELMEYVGAQILPNCKKCFIINSDNPKGFLDKLKQYLYMHFTKVSEFDYIKYNAKVFMGEKK